MSYLGSTPTTQNFIAGTDSFNGTGSATNFTLSRIVNSVNDIQVVVNNVVQYPPNYSVSGTTLTISPAPSSGTNNVYVRYLSTTLQSITVPGGSAVNGTFQVAQSTYLATSSGSVGIGTTSPIRTLTVTQPTSPEFVLQESSGSANAKNWRIFNSGNRLYFGTLNDAGTSGTDAFSINSSGKMLNASGNPVLQQTGSILQVVQTVKSDVFSSTSTSYVDITGMSASITPTSTSSKILVMVSFTGGSTAVNNIFQYKLLRGASDIFVGDPRSGYNSVTIGGGRGIYDINGANTFAFNYLDSPSTTSSTTYKLQGRCEGGTFRMNANGSDTASAVWSFTSASSIILMEVAG